MRITHLASGWIQWRGSRRTLEAWLIGPPGHQRLKAATSTTRARGAMPMGFWLDLCALLGRH